MASAASRARVCAARPAFKKRLGEAVSVDSVPARRRARHHPRFYAAPWGTIHVRQPDRGFLSFGDVARDTGAASPRVAICAELARRPTCGSLCRSASQLQDTIFTLTLSISGPAATGLPLVVLLKAIVVVGVEATKVKC